MSHNNGPAKAQSNSEEGKKWGVNMDLNNFEELKAIQVKGENDNNLLWLLDWSPFQMHKLKNVARITIDWMWLGTSENTCFIRKYSKITNFVPFIHSQSVYNRKMCKIWIVL